MRLIATFESEREAQSKAAFLQLHQVESVVEENQGRFELWVLDEDLLGRCRDLLQEYKEDPLKEKSAFIKRAANGKNPLAKGKPPFITYLCILICTILYLLTAYQSTSREGSLFQAPVGLLESSLLYDDPEALQLARKFNETYKIPDKEALSHLPPEGKALLMQIHEHPYWPGLYEKVLEWRRDQQVPSSEIFESLKHGQVWRLVTPIFLHANILHLLFNMLWLGLLGKSIESRIGSIRYSMLIIIAAIVTNTFQYLMTGPLFMGFSGVICAFGGYIWVRKKKAPWEVYLVDSSALIFLGVFIIVMALLQAIAFFLEFLHTSSFQMGIANTAHVSGLLLGLCLARIRWLGQKL